MGALPKQRTSHARKGKRRAHLRHVPQSPGLFAAYKEKLKDL